MGHFYFDSSALVKRYVLETGTEWVNSICLAAPPIHTIYTVRVTGAEIVAAFFLRVRTGSVKQFDAQTAVTQFKTDFSSFYQIVEVTINLVDSAMKLAEAYQLRGYDSIQLAAALALHETRLSLSLSPITFVCADNRLNIAAATEGLIVENPNNY